MFILIFAGGSTVNMQNSDFCGKYCLGQSSEEKKRFEIEKDCHEVNGSTDD